MLIAGYALNTILWLDYILTVVICITTVFALIIQIRFDQRQASIIAEIDKHQV